MKKKTRGGTRKKHKNAMKHTMKHTMKHMNQSKRFTSKTQCSPKPPEEMNSYSCYTNSSLMLLKNKWNQRHTDAPIHATEPRQIYNELKNKLLDSCDKESCWLEVLEAGATPELKEAFVPKAPAEWKKKPNAWLSSVDITRVMKQFEHAYKCFEFLGPSPIDFDTRLSDGKCVWDELCNFQLSDQI